MGASKKSPLDVLDARFLASATTLAALPPPAFAEIAFAGRSNVGKSSLINSLVERKKLVRTSSTPGCTRGINSFRVSLRAGATIDLIDLPGYGYAKRSKAERRSWGPLIEGFLESRPGLCGVVVIVDVRRGLEDDDRELLGFLEHVGRRAWLVATKTDKVKASKRKAALAHVAKQAGTRVFGYSSTNGEGRDALLRHLLREAHVNPADDPDTRDDTAARPDS